MPFSAEYYLSQNLNRVMKNPKQTDLRSVDDIKEKEDAHPNN